MAYARQPPSSRPTEQLYKSPGGLEVITYVGDITTITDADAIVTGEGEKFENESFITKALLRMSPLEFAQKRHELIEKHKTFYKWNIYTSELMPPSQFRLVFHAVMNNNSKRWTKKMKKMYKRLFKKADKYHVEALVLPLLGSGRANVSVEDTVQAVIESITKIHDPQYLRMIYLVTLDKDKAEQIATQCQFNFHKQKKSFLEKLLGCTGSKTTDEDGQSYKKAPRDKPNEKKISTDNTRQSFTFPRKSTAQTRHDTGGSLRDQRKGRPQIGVDTFNQTSHSSVREDWQKSSTYSESHDNPPVHETRRNNSSGDQSKSRQSNSCPRNGAPQERIEEGRSMRENHRTEHHPRGDAMPSGRQIDSERNRQKRDDQLQHDTRGKQFKGYQGETNKTVHTIQTQNHNTLAVGLTAVECHKRSLNAEIEPGRRANERDTDGKYHRTEYHRTENHPRGDAMPFERQRDSESNRQKCEGYSHVDDDHLQHDSRGKHTTREQSKGYQGETNKTVHSIETQDNLAVGLVAVECHERSLNVEMEPGRRASERDTERNEHRQRQRNGNRPTFEHSKDKGENKRSVTAETHDVVAKQSKRQTESGTAKADHQDVKDTESNAVNMLDLSVSRNCPICISPITDPKWLDKCGHVFCRKCIDDSFQHFKPVCPSCNMVYGILTGNQPDGNMDVGFSGDHLPGYEGHGTITITYYFPSGTQGKEHPNPGQQYKGTTRRAYLPDCSEGREVLKLLKTAFDRKLTFTIGRSTTTGQENVVTWNDIHHKTNMDGGPTRFGYPDPGYLGRVKEELAGRGVTQEDKKGNTAVTNTKKESTF